MDCRVTFLTSAVVILSILSQGEAQFGYEPPYGQGWGNNLGQPPAAAINCSDLICGAGSCNSSYSSTNNGNSYSYNFSYSFSGGTPCQCKSGWTSFLGYEHLDLYAYRPCVFPNCTLTPNCSYNYPQPKYPDGGNKTAQTDPCAWTDCGDGTCVALSVYNYRCDCNPGFKNLFNNTAFPCLNDCLLSDDCKKVGASFSANAISEIPDGNNGQNKGVATAPGNFLVLLLFMILVALA